jgi:hypothetical protein
VGIDPEVWKAFARVLERDAWMAIPILVGIALAWKSPAFLKVFLKHRQEMWKLKNAELKRLEAVEKRQLKASKEATAKKVKDAAS